MHIVRFQRIALATALLLAAHGAGRAGGGEWRMLKLFQGEFLGGTNTAGAQREKLEAQAHRHVRFAIPAAVRLRVAYTVDEKFIPAYWPKDIALSPGITLNAVLKGPGKGEARHLVATSSEFDAPAGSVLTLYIDEDTYSSGYKTFYPAKWRITVHYRDAGQAHSALPAVTGQSSGVQTPAPPPAPTAAPPAPDVHDPPAPDCGVQAECAAPALPEPVQEAPRKTDAKAASAALDLAFWNSVKDSANPVLLRAYLEKFPDGVFAVIAREKLKGLRPPPAAPPATPGQAARGKKPSVATLLKQAEKAEDLAASLKLYLRAAQMGSARASAEAAQLIYQDSTDAAGAQRAFGLFRSALAGGYYGSCDNYIYALLNENHTEEATGVFIACYRARPEETMASIERWGVRFQRVLQKKLKAAGRYRGAIDGAFGPASRAALEAFAQSGAVKTPALVISPRGVGPVTGKTPYTLKALRAALPGFVIREENYSSEGDISSRFIAFRNGRPAMRFEGEDTVSQIAVHDPAIATRDGLRAGMSLAALKARGLTRGMRCHTGADDAAEKIFCTREGFYLTFVFRNGAPVGFPPDEAVPPAKMPGKAQVSAILWFSGD